MKLIPMYFLHNTVVNQTAIKYRLKSNQKTIQITLTFIILMFSFKFISKNHMQYINMIDVFMKIDIQIEMKKTK